MAKGNAALRPYLEDVEKICRGLKKSELVDLVVRIAGEEAPDDRNTFLGKVQRIASGEKGVEKQSSEPGEVQALLNDVQTLRESIMDRIDSIENGTYWDDPDEHDYDEDDYSYSWRGGYYNDEPEYLSVSHKEILTEMFDISGNYFLQGKLEESASLYKELFALVAEVERVAYMPGVEVGLPEAHARYCRAVYELSPAAERVAKMVEAMDVSQRESDYDDGKDEKLAMLQDVIDAQVGELPEMPEFVTS